jgi:hypothetical protein
LRREHGSFGWGAGAVATMATLGVLSGAPKRSLAVRIPLNDAA